MLDLDFAYARITDPANESRREWLRSADGIGHHAEANEIGRALEAYLAAELSMANFRIANPLAAGTASIAIFQTWSPGQSRRIRSRVTTVGVSNPD
jgi:hypothetical protein